MKKEDAIKVCDLIIEDGLTCVDACKRIGVKEGSFFYMVNKDTDIFELYARARQVQSHRWIDQIITIADRPSGDSVENADKRTMIDTRKWAASKALPKIYGDKLQIDGNVKHEHSKLPEWMNESKS